MDDKIEKQRPFDEFSDFFNDGYNLAQNNPDLFETVLWENEGNNERSKALIWGRWMFEQEMKSINPQSKEQQILLEIQAIRNRGKERSRTIEKDKIKVDPETRKEVEPGFIKGFLQELERPAREIEQANKEYQNTDIDREYE